MNTENQETEVEEKASSAEIANDATSENKPEGAEEQKEADSVESDEDVIVTFGDDEGEESQKPEEESPTFKNLRKINREKDKELKRLKKELEKLNQPNEEAVLRKKPTFQDCEYDDDKFESDLINWYEEKKTFEAKQQEKKKEELRQVEYAQSLKNNYESRKKVVKYTDFEEVEADVSNALSQVQQDVILYSSEKPEMIVYALGKNPKILEDLAKETHPIRFASKLGKLEVQMKIKSRKPITKPDTPVKGSGGVNASTDKVLEELREEARRTKNFSKLHAYKRKLKQSN